MATHVKLDYEVHMTEVSRLNKCYIKNYGCFDKKLEILFTILHDINNNTNFVLVTLIEILPKEKKQREEKTNVLGQASVDVMPLLSGKTITCFLNSSYGTPFLINAKSEIDLSVASTEKNFKTYFWPFFEELAMLLWNWLLYLQIMWLLIGRLSKYMRYQVQLLTIWVQKYPR